MSYRTWALGACRILCLAIGAIAVYFVVVLGAVYAVGPSDQKDVAQLPVEIEGHLLACEYRGNTRLLIRLSVTMEPAAWPLVAMHDSYEFRLGNRVPTLYAIVLAERISRLSVEPRCYLEAHSQEIVVRYHGLIEFRYAIKYDAVAMRHKLARGGPPLVVLKSIRRSKSYCWAIGMATVAVISLSHVICRHRPTSIWLIVDVGIAVACAFLL